MNAFLSSMNIGTRLKLSFALLALLVGGVGGVGYLYINRVNDADNYLFDNQTEPLVDILNVSAGNNQIRAELQLLVHINDPVEIQAQETKIHEISDSIEKCFIDFEKRVQDADLRKDFDALKSDRSVYVDLREKVMQLAKENKDEEAWVLMNGDEGKAMSAVIKDINVIVAKLQISAQRTSDENDVLTANADHIMMVLIGVALFFAVLLGFVVTESIVIPLQEGVTLVEKMKNKDLSARLLNGNSDELGVMTRALNNLAETWCGILGNLSINSQTVAASTEELQVISTQIAGNAKEVNNQSQTIAAATEQASVNSNAISAAAEELSGTVHTVASSIEELTTSIRSVADQCKLEAQASKRADANAKVSQKVMDELGAAAQEIGKIVNVITDIAAQTNLLALNATIEAASAGEAGKGFAVVATEVKDLARQTTSATEKIRNQIEKMQSSVNDAVRAIADVSKVIEDVAGISSAIDRSVDEQNNVVGEVAKNIAGAAQASREIARNVSESAHGLSEISRGVAKVNESSKQTAQGVTQISTSVIELNGLSASVHNIVVKFKTK